MKRLSFAKLYDTGVPALVWRWMAVSARQPATHSGRLVGGLICGAILISFFYIFSKTMGMSMAQAGQQVFDTLLCAISIMMSFGSVIGTSDLLSREKREETIGLLFLTPLSSWQLVAGKFVTNTLVIFMGSLVYVPVLLIPVLAGGVTLAEGIKVACTLLTVSVFGCALGLCASAFHTDPKKANSLAASALVVVGFVIPGILTLLTPRFTWLADLNVLLPSTLVMGFAMRSIAMQTQFWTCFPMVLIESALLLAISAYVLKNTWQQGNRLGWWQVLRAKWIQRTLGPAGWRLENRRELLELNPITWLTGREWRSNLRGLGAPLALLMLCGIIEWLLHPNPNISVTVTALISIVPAFMLIGRFHNTALSPWADARANGVLELILTTPLTERRIMTGVWLALRRQFCWNIPACLLTEGWGAALATLIAFQINPSVGDWNSGIIPGILWVFFWRWLNLAMDMFTVGWTAPWYAISAKTSKNARLGSLPVILALPWVTTAIIMAVWGWLELPVPEVNPLYGLPLVFLTVNLLKCTVMVVHARWRFLGSLREIAAKRYEVTA